MSYILKPQNMTAQLVQQTDPNSTEPEFALDVTISDFGMRLDRLQYQAIFRIADFVRRYQWK